MSGETSRPNSEIFEHVRSRLEQRYRLTVTLDQWLAWNAALRSAVEIERNGRPLSREEGKQLTVREIDHEGQKVVVLCSPKRVLTVLVRKHALRLWGLESV